MRRRHLFAILMGILLVEVERNIVSASDETTVDSNAVVVLNDENFDEIVGKSQYALVKFYAPWCEHCKALAPHYSEAATELKSYDPSVVLAEVDVTLNETSKVVEKYEIKSLPTLKWFVDGKLATDYSGTRAAQGIVSWVKKKMGPVAATIESTEKLAELEKESPVLFVAYFKEFSGAEYEVFQSIAYKTEDVPFVQTNNLEVAKAVGVTKPPGIAVVKNFEGEDREIAVFSGDADKAEHIMAFIISEKLPLTIELKEANMDKIFSSGISKQIILWSKGSDLSADSPYFAALKAVSKAFKGQFVFVTVSDEGDSSNDATAGFFGLKGLSGPLVVGYDISQDKKYRHAGEITEASLTTFVQSILDGTIVPLRYKSAEIPEEHLDEGVTVVVGQTFDSIVLDKTKDVLLKVYAPYCPHSKRLAPTYVQLAEHFAPIDTIVIAKIDGTENEHPAADVKGYPTFLFYPAGDNKTAIVFDPAVEADRNLKNLTKFVKKHATIKFELPKKAKESRKGTKDEL